MKNLVKTLFTILKLVLYSLVIIFSINFLFSFIKIGLDISESFQRIGITISIICFLLAIYSIVISPSNLMATQHRKRIFQIGLIILFLLSIFTLIILVALPLILERNDPTFQLLIKNSLVVSFLFVLILMQFTIRKSIILQQTWKSLSGNWLTFIKIPVVSIGGFGIIGMVPSLKIKFIKISTSPKLVNMELVLTIYISILILLGLAWLLILLGKSISVNDESNQPLRLFIPTFAIVWLCNLGVFSLFFYFILLTLNAHVSY